MRQIILARIARFEAELAETVELELLCCGLERGGPFGFQPKLLDFGALAGSDNLVGFVSSALPEPACARSRTGATGDGVGWGGLALGRLDSVGNRPSHKLHATTDINTDCLVSIIIYK